MRVSGTAQWPAGASTARVVLTAGDHPELLDDARALAFMDIMPRADGHVLVIPKNAGRTILDTPLADLQAAVATVQRVAASCVRQGYKPIFTEVAAWTDALAPLRQA